MQNITVCKIPCTIAAVCKVQYRKKEEGVGRVGDIAVTGRGEGGGIKITAFSARLILPYKMLKALQKIISHVVCTRRT
jgi:molybdenum-dependent DNA-binding transcriptional regulator ModE